MDRIALELNNILAIIVVSNSGLEAAATRAATVTRQLLEIEAEDR